MIQQQDINNEEEYYDSETEPSLIEDQKKPEEHQQGNNQKEKTGCGKLIYAVQFLNSIDSSDQSSLKKKIVETPANHNRIFINADSAKNLCKEDPDNRRFKVFRNFIDAYSFSYNKSEIKSGCVPSIAKLEEEFYESISDSSIKEGAIQFKPQDFEKLPFSAPKKSEINLLRSHIEKNEVDLFKSKVLSNPRFLISSGDSPIVVQESFRYNCLHTCAKINQYEICDFILKTLASYNFIQFLYKNDSIEQAKNRSEHLLDLYLNMPEKGLNETPLHFACKYGSFEVVKLLISQDQCERDAVNKMNKTARQIICSKSTQQSNQETYNLINSLFENCYYINIYRDNDKGDIVVDQPTSKLNLSLQLNENNSFQPLKLACFVGPVSPKIANEIYDKIKTPSKLRQSPQNRNILRSDEIKGFERITRKYTNELNLPWGEYWSFLDGYYNLNTQIGLEKLESYLKQKEFQSILNYHETSADNIINDKLNNNEEKNCIAEIGVDIIRKLNELKKIIILIVNGFELKENVLSTKFEQFTKIKTDLLSNEEPQKSEKLSSNDDFKDLKISINRYLSIILEISKVDNICYFYFYKSSKKLFDIINCFNINSDYFLSISNNFKNENGKKQSELFRKLNYDLSDEEDINNTNIVEENTLIDELESKFTSLSINDNREVKTNTTMPIAKNHFRINSDKINNSFKNQPSEEKRIFMIGTQPTKIDKSVFFCLDNNQISENLYPNLFKWYNFMQNVEKNEMQKWKTPQKNNFKQVLKRL